MKLFAWQPSGHGEDSFFVAAESEDLARAFVDKYISANYSRHDPLSSGWGTDYYELTVVEAQEVVVNSND